MKRKTDKYLKRYRSVYEEIITAGLLSAGISAAVSVGIFVGSTRTRLKHLEQGLKDLKEKDLETLKKDLKEFTTLSDSSNKNELDGRTKVLEQALKDYKEQLDGHKIEVSGLTRLFTNAGFDILTRAFKKGAENG